MFGGTGNNNSNSGGFGFNLGGNKPTTSFGASAGTGSASNIFSTPSNTNTTSASAAGGVAPKPAPTAFAFGTPTASGSSGAGGSSIFGTTASKPETSKPSGAFSFGTSSAGSSGTSLFGTGSGAQGSGSTLGGAGGNSLFNTSKPPAVSFAANTSVPAASASTASGSIFGATTSAAPTASMSGGGLGFSGFGTASAASAAETKPAAPFSLASSAATTTAASAANPTSGTGLGGFKLSTAPAVSSESTAAATTSAEKSTGILSKPTGVSTTENLGDDASKKDSSVDLANAALRGKTLEEIAQMWTSELATQTRTFHTQANTVGYWDRALVQQGKRITELYEATMGVEAEQAALDQSLEHMEGQQTALQNLLDTYEGRIQDIVHKTTTRPTGTKGVAMTADEERDHVYSSAERLNTQLDELARRLTTLVEDVNGISNASSSTAGGSSSGDADGQRGAADPFAQIVEILNAHLTSLEWVDSQTTQLQDRVKTAQRVYQDVASAQSSLTGAYGGVNTTDSYGDDSELAASGGSIPTIPGAFVNDPVAPPATSTFGTPMGNLRKPQGSSLGNRGQQASSFGAASAAPQSPFANAFQRRGF
ncbi:FG-nucleoporin nsp1 [Coemansia sp. RSA 1813]|nr:FG-nucleoporin nsp1 [Coemansia sp. RSA 1646]KAJ1770644.1 FG-nucleoporin nsp1 [Coemansia sp. RSA 1843]KAJ2093428.1 FG-nucleoporin nsp1 [Coemansia sp. RSA 986]KAJ2217236.1 FG-nucleoporin nsp1 [Coemansia sp. RSA 487]KAJ2572436.1 FG-nucleoporin nsp1 [Coemansia sp. RSA 1813]